MSPVPSPIPYHVCFQPYTCPQSPALYPIMNVPSPQPYTLSFVPSPQPYCMSSLLCTGLSSLEGRLPTAYAMLQNGHQIEHIQRQLSPMMTSLLQPNRNGRECSRGFPQLQAFSCDI